MTRAEILQILAILKAAFPHSYKNMGKRDIEALVNLWLRQFATEDPQIVSAAVDSLIATRKEGYSPTIGEIKEQIYLLQNHSGIDEAAAWHLVSQACRNGLYGYREEFNKLPPEVQAAVGGPEQLRTWAAMESETVESVVASNFRKSFRTTQERRKQLAMYPDSVRAMLSGVVDQLQIGVRTDCGTFPEATHPGS